MKIALVGYGKMGKIIEKVALSRGHEIVLRKSSTDNFEGLTQADVAIDFSVPAAAVENISTCLIHHIPVISGTTGWLQDFSKMTDLCLQENGAFLYGSNFSLGVNLFFEINRKVAQLMAPYSEYQVSMEEIHHTQKLDAPSGTAISLANDIVALRKLTGWALHDAQPSELAITAKRIDQVPGTHTVYYDSIVDQIQITHTAHNREGFALGAVIAAEWIIGKTGVFSMKNVLEID